jgi:signal transduction histidine kinase
MVDITERKQAEEALRLSEKLAATGRLAASIAHEINNPMAAVTNLLYLIENQPEISDETRRFARLAEDEMARVSHITRQMLGFYRDSVAPMPVHMNEVLKKVVELYARRMADQKISVECEFEETPAIWAFPGEMRQVFSNLLLNAVQAVGRGGRIRLRVARAHDWRDMQRGGVRITFADNGHGIRPEHRQRLFEPFFSTRGQNGTGLGLWVSYGIVQKHGGAIRVRSSAGAASGSGPQRSGTCFSIFIPSESNIMRGAAQDAATSAAKAAGGAAVQGENPARDVRELAS